MSNYCTNNPMSSNEAAQPKQPFSAEEKANVAKSADETSSRLLTLGRMTTEDEIAAAKQRAIDARWNAEIGNRVVADPRQYDRLSSFLAARLGETHVALVSTVKSVPGAIHDELMEYRRVASQMVDIAGKYTSVQRAKAAATAISGLAKKYGIGYERMMQIADDAIAIGGVPAERSVYGSTTGLEHWQAKRYINFENQLQQMGVSAADIDGLKAAAADISSAHDEMRTVAQAFGINDGDARLATAFPKMTSADFDFRIAHSEKLLDLRNEIKAAAPTAQEAWTKLNSVYHYIPESSEAAAQLLGTTADHINSMLLDPDQRVFRNYLESKVNPKDLDNLVMSGVMSKLPMTSQETFNYLVDKYQLPYQHLNEMFRTDPVRALTTYGDALKKSVADYAVNKAIIRDGAVGGWTVTPDEYQALGANEVKNFQHVSELGLQKYDINLANQNLYVHRAVADQWRALTTMGSSPAVMGQTALWWQHIADTLKEVNVLKSNMLYAGRMTLQSVVQSVAAGGDLTRWMGSFYDNLKLYRQGLDAFDNTAKFAKLDGEWLTHRQFMEKFTLHRGNGLVPWKLNGEVQLDRLNPMSRFKYLQDYSDGLKDPAKGIHYAADMLKNMAEETMRPFGAWGNLMEQTSKLTAAQSVVERADGGYHMQPLFDGSLKRTSNELWEHLDNHFINLDDQGAVGGVVNYIRPFASWALKNPPMQMRAVLREPLKYRAYIGLLQAWNNQQGMNELPEGAFMDRDGTRFPLLLQKDAMDKYSVALIPTNFDPFLNAMSFGNRASQDMGHALGYYTGSSEKQREQVKGPETIRDVLNDFVSDEGWSGALHPGSGPEDYSGTHTDVSDLGRARQHNPFNLVSDTIYDQKQNMHEQTTFMGIPMPRLAAALLSTVPGTRDINDWNPGGIFGQRQMTDAHGNITRPEKLSIFGTQRTDADPYNVPGIANKPLFDAARLMGADVKYIQPAINMQYSLKDIEAASGGLLKGIQENMLDLQEKVNSGAMSQPEYERRSRALRENIDNWAQMETDRGRVLAWMYNNRIPEQDVIKKLRDARIAVSGLPLPASDEMRRILSTAREYQSKLNATSPRK